MKILINIAAIIAGWCVGALVNGSLIAAGPQLIPPPAGVNLGNAESMAAGAHVLAPKHLLFPFLAHALGTFVGALVAHQIGRSARVTLAYVIGGCFFAGGVAMCFLIPAPAWFVAIDLLLAYLPMTWLAIRLGNKIRPSVPVAHFVTTGKSGAFT
ncbi:hypothetical protein [Oleiharenicola lentus]|uniref:hypothetical protein n=1 Tax=Oleiharenicola lentus TaxID=2508720 RepID=UPI003F6813F5